MNTDERHARVSKVINKTLSRVLGGSIQETSLNLLVTEIDDIYKPYLAFDSPEETVSEQ